MLLSHTLVFYMVKAATAKGNVFNNYFTYIAKKTNSNIKFSPKHYTDYLSYLNTNTFFLTPTDKNEISQ